MQFFRRREDKADALRQVPLFEDLAQQEMDQIAQHADEIHVEASEVLTRQGHLGHEFILIVQGRARVERDGKLIAHVEAGDSLGEMALIDGKPRSATVTTEEPSVLLVMQSRSFSLLLDTVPGLQRRLLMTLCRRLRAAEERELA